MVVPKTTLEATGIEVTQVAQNASNTDLLVAGKKTYAVVRARTRGGNVPAVGVTAWLRNDATDELVRPLPDWERVTLVGKPSMDNSVNSFVFELPESWTQAGELRLTAEINPDFTYPGDNPTTTATASFMPSSTTVDVVMANLVYPHVKKTGGKERFAAEGTAAQLEEILQNYLPVPAERIHVTQIKDQLLPFDALNLSQDANGKPLAKPQDHRCGDVNQFLQDEVTAGRITLPPQTILYAFMPPASKELDDGTRARSVYGDTGATGHVAGCVLDAPKQLVASGVGPDGGNLDTVADTVIHEIGHLLGLRHVMSLRNPADPANSRTNCGSPDNPTLQYPDFPGGTIGRGSAAGIGSYNVGFNAANLDTAEGEPIVPGWYGDVMTYCADKWMSDYTYRKFDERLPNIRPTGVDGGLDVTGPHDALQVSGSVDTAYETAVLSGVATGRSTGSFADDDAGPYHLRLFDAAGAMLADHTFGVASADTDLGEESTTGSFSVLVPLPAGARRVAVYSDRSGREVVSQPISASAPTVTVTSPAAGSTLPASGSVTVAWNGTDSDNDTLTYSVSGTSDGGDTWQTLATNVTDTSVEVDARSLPGAAGDGRIRVTANDGANTGYGQTANLTIPSKPPTVTINSPDTGARATTLAAVPLDGSATDPQDGTLGDARLRWSSDRDGTLGTGGHLLVDDLTPGQHTLTLTATNAHGQTSSATTAITIGPDVPKPTTLRVTPDRLTIPYDAETGVVTRALAVDNLGTGTMTWRATSDNPRVRLATTTGSPPDQLRFTVDTGGLPGGGVVDANISIASDEASNSPRTVPIRLVGVQPAVTLSAGQLGFGGRVVGGGSVTREVTLTNNGNTALELGESTVTGGAPEDFARTEDSCHQATVQAGEFCTVKVTFTPSAAGERSAYLTLSTQTPHRIPLTGFGTVLPATADTEVISWGGNISGQAGVPPSTKDCGLGFACMPTPVVVPGLSDVSTVAAGGNHNLALKADGTVWAWGSNDRGQLGLGATDSTKHTTPTRIPSLDNVVGIAAGDGYSLAVKADGSVWGWGQDQGGNINHCFCNVTSPVHIIDGATAVATGTHPGGNNLISYALRADGSVWQWGDFGGFGFVNTSPHPIQGPPGTGDLNNVVAITHRMALKADGTVWAWGAGSGGQLGNGTRPTVSMEAVQVLAPNGAAPLTGVVAIAGAANQRYALKADGTLLAWGDGTPSSSVGVDYFRGSLANITLGTGPVTNFSGYALPVPVVAPAGTGPLSDVAAIAPGVAVRANGTAVAWGHALIGELGNGTHLNNGWDFGTNGASTPVQVHGLGGARLLANVSAVAGVHSHLAIVGGQPLPDAATPPPVNVTVAREPDSGGWYNHPVSVTWESPDGEATCEDTLEYAGPDARSATVVGYCSNPAGRSGSTSFTLDYDATPPTTTATIEGTEQGPGYAPPVTVRLHGSDDTSGVDGTFYTLDSNPDPQTYDGPITIEEPGYHRVTFWSTDRAGNVEEPLEETNTVWFLAAAGSEPPTVDAGPDTTGTTGVAVDVTGTASDPDGDEVTTTWSVSGSGCTLASPEELATTVTCTEPGTYTLALSADDGTNQPVTDTAQLRVSWPFDGFRPPIDNPSPTPVLNQVKAGSTVPVKFSLAGSRGLDILAAGSPSTVTTSCSAVDAGDTNEEPTTATAGLHYDFAADQYIYNWKTTKSWANSCRVLRVDLVDGSRHIAYFKFT